MHPGKILRPVKLSFISTYPPRQCGIATFCGDLLNSMKELYGENADSSEQKNFEVIALNSINDNFNYDRTVTFHIRGGRLYQPLSSRCSLHPA